MVLFFCHYSDYFFLSLLKEIPEAFLVAAYKDKIVGYIMCKIEFGFSNFRKLGFVKKGHVVSIAVLEEHRGNGIGEALMIDLGWADAKSYLKGLDQQKRAVLRRWCWLALPWWSW